MCCVIFFFVLTGVSVCFILLGWVLGRVLKFFYSPFWGDCTHILSKLKHKVDKLAKQDPSHS